VSGLGRVDYWFRVSTIMPVGREWALIQKLEPNYIPGTPGIFSMSQTLKRHKRQTATGKDKCTLMIEKPLLGIIADIHNTAVGICM
jgi:hypothetical protein